ncbi:MAG: CAP domain-containing protein [Candidatus Bathyarchaeota archaeon]
MGICYHCGRELEQPIRCPHCNLSFCEDHIQQRAHNCIALSNRMKTYTEEAQKEAAPYVESVEAPTVRPRVNGRKRGRGFLGLGPGVTQRKVAFVAITLAISLGSIAMINYLYQEPESPGAGPMFPTSPETLALQEYVLELVNAEREKAKLEALTLDTNPIAQRYAEEMLRTGEFKHNPDLPGTMGENIKYYSSRDEVDAEGVLSQLMYEMVYDDAAYSWGHRDQILNKDYKRVSIGVAYDRNRLYLVQDFS